MRTEEFDYLLPKELIAQHPEGERASSRLLVLDRPARRVEHRHFRDITAYLREKDLIVVNDTKVLPARLTGMKETGGRVDILLAERLDGKSWSCLATGIKRGAREARVSVDGMSLRLRAGPLFWTVEFPEGTDPQDVMARYGKMPLPHYIKRGKDGAESGDDERYQTVYARSEGSIAAPTAGLHFNEDVLSRIERMGAHVVRVTLHIGVGTFFPVKSENVEGHEMHREYYSISPDIPDAVRKTREGGGRVIAVGTSAVRTLETVCAGKDGGPLAGYTGLFIYPGYTFRVVDCLITNFHLPRSTPLLLVCAFAGKETIQGAYREAIERGYRFYSYGDAMFIS
ncbi:MAG: tRNA preQ1(34) S-adenosylmethionine ribosyltransferase-isomerase QueA [Syntrophorhabdales bacterium]|jgi:S-adenosylmethionine:tRNA ribosyltransferase-isomerase